MPDDKIPGGYILQPRKIDESGVMKEPPIIRELWLYLIRKVNWKDGNLPRGTGFFRFVDIQNDLCWYVGFRKMQYSKPRLTKALRRLCEGNMTATTKATRGIIITILNYDYYQDPKNYEDQKGTEKSWVKANTSELTVKNLRRNHEGNMTATVKATQENAANAFKQRDLEDSKNYEGNNEDPMKKQRRKSSGHTIIKEGEEVKEQKKKDLVVLPDFIPKDLWQDFKEHRNKLKGTMTERAQKLLIKKISDMSDGKTEIAQALIEQSIEMGWKGVFPLKDNNHPQTPKATTVYQADMLQKELVNQEYLRQRRQDEESDSGYQDAVDIKNSPKAIN